MDPSIPLWVRTPSGVAFLDIPVQPGGRLPSFLIIGAAKSGTTSLAQFLGQHPGLYMLPMKEPHFISTYPIYNRGLDWYEGLFAGAPQHCLCGEGSTSYTNFPLTPLTPQRVHAVCPDIKLIYIVREPVSRVESECLQIRKYCYNVLKEDSLPSSCDELLEKLQDASGSYYIDPISKSEYIKQIDEYLKFFDRKQLLVLLQDDLLSQPEAVLRKVCEFLDIDGDYQFDTSRNANVTVDFTTRLSRDRLSQFVSGIPGYSLLKPLISGALRQRASDYLAARMSEDILEKFSDATRSRLKGHFEPFNRQLSDFLGRDLSHWDA